MKLIPSSLLFFTIGVPLHGAGFQLAERSAKGLGRAFSGEAAVGDDAAILGSNPAGMSLLDDWSFSMGSTYVMPEVSANGIGITGAIRDDHVVHNANIPNTYLSKKLNEQFNIGLGIYTTFGLNSDYSTQFATGAIVDHSDIVTFNVGPVISYRLSKQWSVGAGFDALFADGQITSLQPGIGGNLFDLTGDDWGFGYNLGVLYELNDETRFGLHFRSSVNLAIEGNAKIGAGFGAFPAGSYEASLAVELPDTFEFSAYHEINDHWAIHADFLWTQWSKFQSLEPKINPLIDPALAKEENWDNSYRIALGTTYRHSEKLTMRAGFAFDESPVNDSNRTLRIPDADRIWASLGISYQLNERYVLDLGYSHIFADDASVSPESLGGNSDAFLGNLKGRVDLVGLGLSASF